MMRERPLRPFALLLIAGLSLAAVVHGAVVGGVGPRPGVQRGRRRDGAGLRRRVWEEALIGFRGGEAGTRKLG